MRAGKSWAYRFVGLAGLTMLIGTVPATADVKGGVDAWSRGDFDAAIREWRDPAAKGDPDAQFNMAQAYKLGRGVPQDLAKAEQLFAKASAQGHLEAGDNLGLILFQRGEKARALPYIQSASGRGDPRAHYILGLAYFNGDGVTKDWERAYALMSLAQQANLPQAVGALSQMDQHISLEQRQRSVALASSISADADATRLRQIAAADLAVTGGSQMGSGRGTLKPFTPAKPVQVPTGADYARGAVPPVASILKTDTPQARKPVPPLASAVPPPEKPKAKAKPATPKPAPSKVAASPSVPKPAASTSPAQKPAAAASGPWRLQLGAFAIRSNADGLWNRVKSRPEVAGRTKLMLPTGRVTRLMVEGYPDQSSAQAACGTMKRGGFECLVTRN